MIDDVAKHSTFEGHYSCEVLSDLPSNGLDRFYFPGAQSHGKDGLIVQVTPIRRAPWFGIFSFGEVAKEGVTAIYTMPNPNQLCVVARGEGYLVEAENPVAWQPVRSIPVIDARVILERKIVVFASFTDLVAYGASGIQWRSERLAWDRLSVVGTTSDYLTGEFWDHSSDEKKTFIVDLTTGNSVGGVSR